MSQSIFLLFIAGLFGMLPATFGQNVAASDTTVQALLAEVRQLRIALERSAILAPRIQVTLQRVQLQQDATTRASRDLETVRSQISNSVNQEQGLAAQLKDLETRMTQEQDPVRRKNLENESRMVKLISEQQVTGMSQLRAREAEAEGRLQSEQAKLSELNDRLNNLERQLEPPPAPPQRQP
jgi:predicted  nucleic acid-binding Zn-ribbon protein